MFAEIFEFGERLPSLVPLLEGSVATPMNRQIVKQLREGNPAGCRNLVDSYQRRLLNEAVAVFRFRTEDAEEVVSDVLLTVIEKIDTFEFQKSDADFHFWIMAIFRNRLRDFVRREAIRGKLFVTMGGDALDSVAFDTGSDEMLESILHDYEVEVRRGGSGDGTDETEATVDSLQVIADTLDSMETWERVLLRCRALEVPYSEIARYTGKPVSQLKVYHSRVKKKFIRLLFERYPELQTQ